MAQTHSLKATQDNLLRRYNFFFVLFFLVAFSTFSAKSDLMAQDITPEATPEETPIIRESVQGSVSGTVTVGTAGVTLPSDTIVSLHIFDVVTQTDSTLTTPIDSGNLYLFSDVTITDGDYYLVSVTFDGRNYGSVPVVGDVDFPNIDMPITVYETTDDPNVIGIMNMVVQIQPTQGVLGFTQVMQFSNQSDRLYLGTNPLEDGRSITLDLTLPVGALVTDVLVMLGEEPVGADDGSFIIDTSTFKLQYTEPIFPAQNYLLIINYVMPYEQDAVMEFPIGHRFIGEFRILVSTDELTVTGAGLTSIGKQMVGDVEFSGYGARYDLMPDDVIRYELSGRVAGVGEFPPNTSATSRPVTAISSDNLPLLMLILGFGIIVIIVGGVLVINRRKNTPDLPKDV